MLTRIWTIASIVWLEMLRKKDFYVLAILLAALLFMLLSVDVFGLGATVRYVLDLGLLMAWVFALILAATMTCRQLPHEEETGTIYPLLAKPLTRGQLLVGKWLGCWLAVAAATAVFYLMIALVVKFRGGTFSWSSLAQAGALHGVCLAAFIALALLCSTRLTYGAAASLSFIAFAGAYWLAPKVPALIMNEPNPWRAKGLLAIYYLFPRFDLFDMRQRVIHEWGLAPTGAVLAVALYGGVLCVLFLLLAWLAYRDKKFKRGGASA